MKILHVNTKHFDLDVIDNVLKNQLPGKYKIVIHTKNSIWECKVNYNGIDWVDLVDM